MPNSYWRVHWALGIRRDSRKLKSLSWYRDEYRETLLNLRAALIAELGPRRECGLAFSALSWFLVSSAFAAEPGSGLQLRATFHAFARRGRRSGGRFRAASLHCVRHRPGHRVSNREAGAEACARARAA